MKRIALLIVVGWVMFVNNESLANCNLKDTSVAPPFMTTSYNDSFFTSVLDAAKNLALPFLLQQGYQKLPGVTVMDTTLVYDGINYPTSQTYNTTRNTGTDGFYVSHTQYSHYGITGFGSVWPNQCPNVLFDGTINTFDSHTDCIGFGSRVLSVVGGGTSTTNAYLEFEKGISKANVSKIAAVGSAPDSYEMATSFATLGTTKITGWQYIAGNVLDSAINAYNLVLNNLLYPYTGVRKGGFSMTQAGDILCFGDGPNASNTGHTMIIANNPAVLDEATMKAYFPSVSKAAINSFMGGNNVYQVDIFDDCNIRHFNDSRTTIDGIGFGSVLIVTDTTDDAPVGYFFSPSPNLSSYTPISTAKVYAICVARYTSPSQLPVSIVSFDAAYQGKDVATSWHTANELNTGYFNVQRSTDGENFKEIGTVKAVGSGADSYSFIDASLPHFSGRGLYYRLQSVDRDGATSYSKVVAVRFTDDGSPLTLYPNPAKDVLTIGSNHIASVQVIDNMGRMIKIVSFTDATNPTLNVSELAKGAYHIKVFGAGGKVSEDIFVKQ